MTVLADTSAWVLYLRQGTRSAAAGLERLLVEREVVTCGPVVAELLIGTPPARRAELGSLLQQVAWSDLNRSDWRRVGEIGAELRAAGATVALTDIEIAVAAERLGADLWTFDSDFERIGHVMPALRLFQP